MLWKRSIHTAGEWSNWSISFDCRQAADLLLFSSNKPNLQTCLHNSCWYCTYLCNICCIKVGYLFGTHEYKSVIMMWQSHFSLWKVGQCYFLLRNFLGNIYDVHIVWLNQIYLRYGYPCVIIEFGNDWSKSKNE